MTHTGSGLSKAHPWHITWWKLRYSSKVSLSRCVVCMFIVSLHLGKNRLRLILLSVSRNFGQILNQNAYGGFIFITCRHVGQNGLRRLVFVAVNRHFRQIMLRHFTSCVVMSVNSVSCVFDFACLAHMKAC